MVIGSFQLVEPDLHLREAFYHYCDAFRSINEPTPPLAELACEDFAAFLRKLEDASQGIGIPPGYVPSTTYWLVCEGHKIVGHSSLRHRLSPALESFGGHIGYAIHPFERRKGYGTLLLKLTLEKAGEIGIHKVLLTCDTDNFASVGVILKNGGVMADQGLSEQTGRHITRYWIDL